MNILRIYDSTRAKLHQTTISQANKLTWLHYFVGMDALQVEFPIGSAAAAYLQKNGWIVDEDDRPFIIKYVYQGQSDNAARVVAYSPHFGFNYRVTRPNQGDAILTATGTADAVVKAFIRDAAPETGERSLGITCLPDQTGGASINEQTRRKPLGSEVVRILAAANRGEIFKWNAGAITFDTYPGKDRTKGNLEGNAECVFAGRLNNVENETYEVDASAEQSTPYVGGAGEGDAREIHAEGTDKAGWDRNEVFIDARDVTAGDTATLTQRAMQAIASAAVTVKAAAKDNVNLVFGKDYDVGDLVTVQVPFKTYEADGDFYKPVQRYLSLQLKITQATITYEGDQMKVDVTFGTTVEQQQVTNSTSSRVSNLEAAGSGGSGGVPDGGLTGQVLKKASDADQDTEWGPGDVPIVQTTGQDTTKVMSQKAITDELAAKVTTTALLNLIYPIGSIYISVSSTSPATLFGGTWSAFGAGRVLVGIDLSDTAFDTVEETGGEKTHTHKSPLSFANISGQSYFGTINEQGYVTSSFGGLFGGSVNQYDTSSTSDKIQYKTSKSSNMPPYITCYMWKRVA